MSQPKEQSLWRWICMRILALVMGSVVMIGFCMWLRFVIQKYWVLNRMPPAESQELAILLKNPERDVLRFHQLADAGFGISYSVPDITSSDWITLWVLILMAMPVIIVLGLRAARPFGTVQPAGHGGTIRGARRIWYPGRYGGKRACGAGAVHGRL